MTVRTRTSDHRQDAPPPERSSWGGDGSFQWRQVFGVQLQTGDLSIIVDESHPNFRASVRRGEVIIGNLELTKWSRTLSGVSLTTASHPNWGRMEWKNYAGPVGVVATTSGISDADIESLGEQQLVRAYAKMNAPNINGGEYLAEFSKTCALLRNPLAGIHKVGLKMRDLIKRRTASNARNYTRALADAWLQYRYGMLPLVYDSQMLIGRAHELRVRLGRERRVARAGSSSTCSLSGSFDRVPFFVGPSLLYGTGGWRTNDNVRAAAGVIYELDAQSLPESASVFFGSRASDLPKLAWDLLPYSFVVDWATNIGDWIQAITPVPGTNIRGSWISTCTDREICFDPGLSEYRYVDGTTITYDPGTYAGSVEKTFSMRRVRNPDLPSTPAVTNIHLSLSRTLDALSLSVKPVLALLSGMRRR